MLGTVDGQTRSLNVRKILSKVVSLSPHTIIKDHSEETDLVIKAVIRFNGYINKKIKIITGKPSSVQS